MASTGAVTQREANQAIKLTDTLDVGSYWGGVFVYAVITLPIADWWVGLFVVSIASFWRAVFYRYLADENFPLHGVVGNWHGPTLALAAICIVAAGFRYSYAYSPLSDRHLASVVTQNVDNECLVSALESLANNGYAITRPRIRDQKAQCRAKADDLKASAISQEIKQNRLNVIEKAKQEALAK